MIRVQAKAKVSGEGRAPAGIGTASVWSFGVSGDSSVAV